MPKTKSGEKDWRPPCTKLSDPDAYKRVGEIVETLILDGKPPNKKNFREVDPELFDRFKESSIVNTIGTWKRKILETHKKEGLETPVTPGVRGRGQQEQGNQQQEEHEDKQDNLKTPRRDEDFDDNYIFFEECEYDDNESDEEEEQEEEQDCKNNCTTEESGNQGKNNTTRVNMKTSSADKRVTNCSIVRIPGNPERVFMQVVECHDKRRLLKIQICLNAGPMREVVENFKVVVNPDGKGCKIEIPISPVFYLLENANALGHHYVNNSIANGPGNHEHALRERFETEDEIYEMKESYEVSFGNLKVYQRLIDPFVRMSNDVPCPTFLFFLEVIEEKVTRKQKISILEDISPSTYRSPEPQFHPNSATSSHSHHYGTTSSNTRPATAAGHENYVPSARASSSFYSPNYHHHRQHEEGLNFQPAYSSTNNHRTTPQTSYRTNHHQEYTESAATATTPAPTTHHNHQHHHQTSSAIDPGLIVEMLVKNLAGLGGFSSPGSSVPATATATSVGQQQQKMSANKQRGHVVYQQHDSVQALVEGGGGDGNLGDNLSNSKYKRADAHVDVSCASRDKKLQMVRTRRRRSANVIHAEEEDAENNSLPVGHYGTYPTSGTAIAAGGNVFFDVTEEEVDPDL